MTSRRVAITGVGAVCALGNDAPTTWEAAKAGRSGAARISRWDPSDLACQIACEIQGFDAQAYFGRDAKKLDLFTQYGVHAADEAVRDSGLDFAKEDLDRCGVIAGSGIGGLNEIETRQLQELLKGPHVTNQRLTPYLFLKVEIHIAFQGSDPGLLILKCNPRQTAEKQQVLQSGFRKTGFDRLCLYRKDTGF